AADRWRFAFDIGWTGGVVRGRLRRGVASGLRRRCAYTGEARGHCHDQGGGTRSKVLRKGIPNRNAERSAHVPRRHPLCCRGEVGAVASDELAPARGAVLLIAASAHRELGQRGVEGGSLLARGDAELVKRLHVLAVERTATRIVEPFIDAGDAHADALAL